METTIKELGEIITGNTPSKKELAFWDSDDICFVKPDDIADEGITLIQDSSEYLSENARLKARIVAKDAVFVTCIGSIGKIGIASKGDYAFNQQINAIVTNDKVLPRYLAYNLLFSKPKLVATANAPVVPIINKTQFGDFRINIEKSLDKQEQIVDTLDKISGIVGRRKRELEELDNLIKARFVEMFGDPISNNKGWSTASLTDICSRIYGGGTPSKSHPEYFEGSIPWVSPKDMKSDVITDSIDHITEDAIANSTTNLVPEGSVLMVIRSGILKHNLPVAINAVPVTINQDMKAFVPGESITASFLRNYFKAIEPDVLAGVRGVTADNIDFKAFQRREVIMPPIYLQSEYEDFCRQIDKSKFVMR